VLGLANNHIMDSGLAGLLSTQRFLEAQRISYFGAGPSRQEAERSLIVKCNGLKVAFLGACDVPHVYATDRKAGVAPMFSKRLRSRIKSCRENADIVVVCLHADLEFVSYPSPSRVRLSRWLVDQGADLVIQHHPHVCQGVELYRNGLIAYSLGNYVFPVERNEYFENKPGTAWGIILYVDVDVASPTQRITYTTIPVTIDRENRTVLSEGMERDNQCRYLSDISSQLDKWNFLRQQRFTRCLAEARSTALGLYYLGRRQGFLAMCYACLKTLRSAYERRWMYSILSWGLWG
jgi:poly-gamma-glutamate synthesis protein (capsule biosynthesis protein)